jgi:hypothetical protein
MVTALKPSLSSACCDVAVEEAEIRNLARMDDV